MTTLNALILGLLQGLTEFLPVSSSGHLVLAQNYLGMTEPELMFGVAVHMGTLAAIVVVFFREIAAAFSGFFRLLPRLVPGRVSTPLSQDFGASLALWVIVGSVPTAIIGLAIHRYADKIYASVTLVGAMLLITGLLLVSTKFVRQGKDEPASMRLWQALVIGTAQGLAVMPGISRSGATIAMGLFCGLSRETAARYSFVLSLPAVIGALLLEVLDSQAPGTAQVPALLAGAFVAAITGWVALTLLLKVVRRGGLWLFAPYCLLLGAGVLASQIL